MLWDGRLRALGATAAEVNAIRTAYTDSPQAAQGALDKLVAGIDNLGLSTMLTDWRAGVGPFGAGYPGGGLPFGTHAALLSGDPADDTSAISAGTGVKLGGIPTMDNAEKLLLLVTGPNPAALQGTDGKVGGPGGTPFSTAVEQTANKGVANGYCDLDSVGKVPAARLTVDAVEFKGVWDASANTPTLADGTGSVGDLYRVSVTGTQNLGSGAVTYAVSDDLILDQALIWRKIGGGGGGGGTITSVFGRSTSAIVAASGDYSVGQITGAAPSASPALTGAPTAPTQAALDSSTKLGTTAYSDAAVAVEKTRALAAEATAQAAAIAASAQALARTAVKTSAYTAAPGDNVPADISGGSWTLTLPTAPADKTRIAVKVITISGTVGSTTLTVAAGGSDVFNKAGGSTSLTLTALFQGFILQYDLATAIWTVQATDTPLGTALGAAKLGTDGKVGGPSGSALTAALAASGLTGATAASRYVGATASGAPVTGTFAVGDYVIDQTGAIWVCTVLGSPGTWVQPMVYYAAGAPPTTVVSTIAGSQTAGSEYTYTVPSGQYQRLLSWFLTATASSTVANRYFGYKILDEHGNVMFLMRSNVAVVNGATTNISISPKAPQFVASNVAQAQSLHIPDIWLWPGCQIVTAVSNGSGAGLLVGDQYTAMSLFFEQLSSTGFTFP